MKRLLGSFVVLSAAVMAPAAWATFHTYQIDEIFSNADGTVQYVVMREAAGMNGQNFWAGHTFTANGSSGVHQYVFTANLPGSMDTGYGMMEAPTAFTRVLIATQGFAALGIVTPDFVVPNGFLSLTNGTINYASVDQVSYMSLPTDGVTALKRDGTTMQNLAVNYAGSSASVSGAPAAASNYEGLWWAAPAGSESGWGINFEHQGDIIFATWFTYDVSGKAWWLSMTANKTAPNTYSGTFYQTGGPAFSAMPFNPMLITLTQVGTGTLTFTDANDGTFAYTVNGVTQAKTITRQAFAALPTCTSGIAVADLAQTTNYQGLWWASPGGSESGWGINFAHEGDIIFATWFTYDVNGKAWWLSMTANKSAPGVYSGTFYQTNGPAFSAMPFNPAAVGLAQVGTATLTFTDGNTGMFAYTVNGVTQQKAITRQVFGPNGGTICH